MFLRIMFNVVPGTDRSVFVIDECTCLEEGEEPVGSFCQLGVIFLTHAYMYHCLQQSEIGLFNVCCYGIDNFTYLCMFQDCLFW